MSHAAPPTLFSGLPAILGERLIALGRPIQRAADEVLFLAEDVCDGCYRVETGLMKVSLTSRQGDERILAILGAGELVGELGLLDGRPRSATVTALRASTLTFFPRAAFESFAAENPDLYRHLTALLASRLRDTNVAVVSAGFLGLKGKVARALLALADAFGHDVGQGRVLVRQKLTQTDIAAMAGIARENASRILGEWQRGGVISKLAGYYCIEQRAVLEAEARL